MAVEVVTAPNWRTFAFKCTAAGDGGLMREVRKEIRVAAKEAGQAVKIAAPDYMPNRYAADLVSSLRIDLSATWGGGVQLRGRARTRKGKTRELKKLEAGKLRHAHWGRWFPGRYLQAVRPGWWSEPLTGRKDNIRRAVKGAMDRVADRIAA
jgi:hypothetical protein